MRDDSHSQSTTIEKAPPQESSGRQASEPLEDLEKELGSSPAGLSADEARGRLEQYGLNELAEKKENVILKLLSYFWGPIPWMIEVAVILSALVKHWADFGIIMTLLVVNACVGFWEEYQAGNAIAALKSKLALRARVKRDGRWTTVPARELVPGDLIRLRLGDVVPADARLIEDSPRGGGSVGIDGGIPPSHPGKWAGWSTQDR